MIGLGPELYCTVLQILRVFTPDPNDRAKVHSFMLNECGRIIDDDELYADMGGETDKNPEVPFFAGNIESINVSELERCSSLCRTDYCSFPTTVVDRVTLTELNSPLSFTDEIFDEDDFPFI